LACCKRRSCALTGYLVLKSGKAHERSADELRDELETLRQKLELVLATDPGVIEQYERRKEEVRSIARLSLLDTGSSHLTSPTPLLGHRSGP
jgi:hypothetical protein